MELGNFRPESHVAQQSRRDKLRVQQSSSSAQGQHLEEYPSNLEQLSVHPGLNPDVIQVSGVRYGNLCYNQSIFPPEMLNFSASSQVLVHQEPAATGPVRQVDDENGSFDNSSHRILPVFNAASKVSDLPVPQNCGTWKSIGSQQSCDWILNYSSGFTGSEGLMNSVKASGISSSALYLKPSFNGNHHLQSSLTNPSSDVSSQTSQKQYEEMHFNPPELYQNAPLAVVPVNAGTEGLELASLVEQNACRDNGRASWTEDGGNELLLLPSYGDQAHPLRHSNNSPWMTRPDEGCHRWSGEMGFPENKGSRDLRTVASDSNTQGLSLSLSSVLPSTTNANRFGENVHSGTSVFNLHNSKTSKTDYLSAKASIGSTKVLGNACQDMVGPSSLTHRNTGPLGPFTGYATILKGSKFLKPAQQLLDEICNVNAPQLIKTYDKLHHSVEGSIDAVNVAESVVGARGGDSGVSSSTFYSSNEISGEAGVRSSSGESYRPEYQQKKAKLLFMQEEISRRYKQYHQQMKMVVSSFESVAGLSTATPYISLALRTVSRHFQCLKNAISDQLKHIRNALGEELPSPITGASSCRGDTSTSRLKFIDHGFMKQKFGGGNLGFYETQQHVWRPQRGLPERAVAILRAWLFEHFLHPYPTDTDKHMLATQTGLSRNQVSNWFINARVRVWKPMVEEIHMLETKGSAEANSNANKNDGDPPEGTSQPNGDQSSDKVVGAASKQVEIGANTEQWIQEKRSRVECQIPSSMDGSLMGFMPYQPSRLEIGGLGAVSLTLGLRQSAESAQPQQEHQLSQHFGVHIIHDFVG
ncbi:BEL1-like homeodomain protein 8 isoform X1 [Diospyros lotus]|uniref:BEL1-like homeodomain protein 8 isoform X1 n=1 Tax=Diospyros lotus TaxID=55363 RepID=UPI002259DE6A|nr:BEL1-like homeodomain protein 8 isoform X1 [Diospyros lotus]